MRVQIHSVGMWFGLAAIACAQPPQSGTFGAGNGPQYGPPGMGGPGSPPPNAMFTAMDADADGAISMRELRKAVVALKQLDADKDGKITQAEATGGPPDPEAMIDRVMENDKDGDGKLSKSEVPRHLAQMISGADANGDGSIDRAELTTAMQNARPQLGVPSSGPGRFGGGFNGDPRPGGPDLSQYDRNHDGQLSADEVPTQLRGMLRGTDQNGDGKLDTQEMQAIQQRINERVRGDRRLPPGVTAGPQGVTGKP